MTKDEIVIDFDQVRQELSRKVEEQKKKGWIKERLILLIDFYGRAPKGTLSEQLKVTRNAVSGRATEIDLRVKSTDEERLAIKKRLFPEDYPQIKAPFGNVH